MGNDPIALVLGGVAAVLGAVAFVLKHRNNKANGGNHTTSLLRMEGLLNAHAVALADTARALASIASRLELLPTREQMKDGFVQNREDVRGAGTSTFMAVEKLREEVRAQLKGG